MAVFTSKKDQSFTCVTVGELKQALSNIDDDLPIASGFEDAIQIAVMENEDNPRDKHLHVDDTDEVSFEQWLMILDNYASVHGQNGSLVEQTGKSTWKEYFDEGMSPKDAYDEGTDY